MKKGTRGEAQTHIAAPPEKVYELVSDITRMGEWSPETRTCKWIGGATGPEVGARFKGTNRRGIMRWSTRPRVVAADPGREFAFASPDPRRRDIVLWRYRFEPEAGGTRATESFEMLRDIPWYILFIERRFMGVHDRKPDLERAMGETLARVKAAAEGGVR